MSRFSQTKMMEINGPVVGGARGGGFYGNLPPTYRKYIGLLIYMFKICHQLCYGFESFMSSWGSGSKISNLQQVGDFSFFEPKSSLLVLKGSFNYVYTLRVHR